MNYRQLQRELNNNIISRAYLFIAKDAYIADSYVKLMKERVVSGELAQLNINVFSDKKVLPGDVKNALLSLPVMSKRRLVVIKEDDVPSDAKLSEMLYEYLSESCESTVLIVYTKQCDKRSKLYKAFEATAKTVQFDKLNDKELYEWIENAFHKKNMKIAKQAVEYLIDALDYNGRDSVADLGYFANETEKLAAYDPSAKEITLEQAKKVVSPNITKDIFKYTESVMLGDAAGALVRMEELIDCKVPVQVIFHSLNKTLRQNALFKYMASNGMREGEIAKQTGAHPYAVKLSLTKYSLGTDESLRAIKAINEADVNIKSGLIESYSAIVLLTERVCSLQ